MFMQIQPRRGKRWYSWRWLREGTTLFSPNAMEACARLATAPKESEPQSASEQWQHKPYLEITVLRLRPRV